MEEKEEKPESLEELFKRTNDEQTAKIAELERQLKERDDLIRAHFTTPTKATQYNEDDGEFSQSDVQKVVELVKKKRT
ncbi:MAG: hypothetical protein KBS70_07365 [Bacteroidales bacterium]|nr:hypothetical protein [Candidatus Colicola equi]